jgi:hypothetical protein
MKSIILLFFIFFVDCQKHISNSKMESPNNILIQNQVGIMNKIPDGPLSEEDKKKAMQEQMEKENGVPENKDVGIVYISNNIKYKKLGKFRIKSEGIHLMFPTDAKYTRYQKFNEKESFKKAVEDERIKNQKKLLFNSEVDFNLNPYKEIYDTEKIFVDNNIIETNKHDYKKHLMSLALEKENDIYNNMIRNELSEIQTKRFNKQIIDHLYKYNYEHNK